MLHAGDEVAAEAEVLITMLLGSRELHDVMIIPRSKRGTTPPA